MLLKQIYEFESPNAVNVVTWNEDKGYCEDLYIGEEGFDVEPDDPILYREVVYFEPEIQYNGPSFTDPVPLLLIEVK